MLHLLKKILMMDKTYCIIGFKPQNRYFSIHTNSNQMHVHIHAELCLSESDSARGVLS